MPYPSWPSDLPRPLRDGFAAQADDPRMRRGSEAGPPRYRRRYSSVSSTVQMRLRVSFEQRGILRSFYQRVLQEGSLPFWMPDWIEDGLPLLDETGRPLLTASDQPLLLTRQTLCLWGDTPPAEGGLRGNTMAISFAVVQLP